MLAYTYVVFMVNTALQNLLDDFEFLTDWEDRYMHVIDLGKQLPPMPSEEKNESTKVKGCVSQVWLVHRQSSDIPKKFIFRGDSDAHIVKGLVAIVLSIYSGLTSKEIQAVDIDAILTKLGLEEHLSPQRSNGLRAMIKRIKTITDQES